LNSSGISQEDWQKNGSEELYIGDKLKNKKDKEREREVCGSFLEGVEKSLRDFLGHFSYLKKIGF